MSQGRLDECRETLRIIAHKNGYSKNDYDIDVSQSQEESLMLLRSEQIHEGNSSKYFR